MLNIPYVRMPILKENVEKKKELERQGGKDGEKINEFTMNLYLGIDRYERDKYFIEHQSEFYKKGYFLG